MGSRITKTRKETRQVLREGNFLIDQRKREDYKFPVGLFDIISLPVTKEDFVLIYDTKGKFQLHKIKSENAKTKLCKIVGKTMLKGKKTQLNISGGCNIIIDKDTYKVGDSVKLSIPDLKIKGHIKFEKGASVYLVGGKHVGKTGKIEEIKKLGVEEDRIIIKTKDDKIETLKNYSIVIEDGLL